MKLDFYYWGGMCPLNGVMRGLLHEYEEWIAIQEHNISAQHQLAKKMHMYYPTLTVLNDTFRYYSPLRREFLEQVRRGEVPRELPYLPTLGTTEYAGKIVPLTSENIYLASQCAGQNCGMRCEEKVQYLTENGMSVFGFLNLNEREELLGGVEYVPAMLVPYDIPRDEKTVFLTCVYLSDSVYDYKTPPLAALEQYLTGTYEKILVISDENGIFPNGDMRFFLKNGYRDEGIIFRDKDYCTLHLMCKNVGEVT